MSWFKDSRFQENLETILKNQGQQDEPIYVYHRGELVKRASSVIQELSGIKAFFAMKANCFRPILEILKDQGYGVDTVSLGEIHFALQAGFNSSDIIFSGVGKSYAEIRGAIRLKIRQINVESLPELLRISEITLQEKLPVNIGLRVNPDVEVNTHPYIATGFRENKFGIDSDQLEDCKKILKSNPLLQFQGFTVHIGSQIHDLSNFTSAYEKLVVLIDDWMQSGFEFKMIDVGGGLGVYYDSERQIEEMLLLKAWVKEIKRILGPKNCELYCELGRFIVVHSGILLAQVEYIKRTQYKNFVILNTGMNHLLRPALYQAKHQVIRLENMKNPLRTAHGNEDDKSEEQYEIVGPICESSDIIAKGYTMPRLFAGDRMAIIDCGAYGAVMAGNYNLRGRVKEIIV